MKTEKTEERSGCMFVMTTICLLWWNNMDQYGNFAYVYRLNRGKIL